MEVTGIAADSRVQEHDTGPRHPEQPARFSAIMNRLESSGLLQDLLRLEVRSAREDELALVHTEAYIELVDREVAQNRRHLSTGDTEISSHSAGVARWPAGRVVAAVDADF